MKATGKNDQRRVTSVKVYHPAPQEHRVIRMQVYHPAPQEPQVIRMKVRTLRQKPRTFKALVLGSSPSPLTT
jgi:hypothetical protein